MAREHFEKEKFRDSLSALRPSATTAWHQWTRECAWNQRQEPQQVLPSPTRPALFPLRASASRRRCAGTDEGLRATSPPPHPITRDRREWNRSPHESWDRRFARGVTLHDCVVLTNAW